MERENKTPDASLSEVARLRYESTRLTLDEVAAEVGCSSRTIKRYSSADGGWQKKTGPELTARAQAAADRISAAVADLPADAPDDAREAVIAQVRATAAVDERAAIIARHRAEVSGPRALAYEGLRKKDMDLLRMAKTAAEALKVTQDLERRAWNIVDAGDAERGNTVVVIERC